MRDASPRGPRRGARWRQRGSDARDRKMPARSVPGARYGRAPERGANASALISTMPPGGFSSATASSTAAG